ncbi:MAG: hypothetical protein ACYS8W_00125 [Planctomycetota bacterium]|jgi:hypothetical protein
MGKTKTTKGIARIEKKLSEIEPGTVRHDVLAAARQFKRSWVEMGEKLAAIKTSSAWKDWGYSSFQDYCVSEIGVRSSTATKLLNSVRFLEEHAPQVLEADGIVETVPDLAVVSRLAGAVKRGAISEKDLAKVSGEILTEPALSPADVSRAIQSTRSWQVYAEEEKLKRKERMSDKEPDWKALLTAAERLVELMASVPEIPDELIREAESVLASLAAIAQS